MKNILWIIFNCLIIPLSCLGQDFNAVIIQHFGENTYEKKRKITIVDPCRLRIDNPIIPKISREADPSTTITKLKISQPVIFKHNNFLPEFVICPGDTLIYKATYFHNNPTDWGYKYDFYDEPSAVYQFVFDTIKIRSKAAYNVYWLNHTNALNRNNYKEIFKFSFIKDSLAAIAETKARWHYVRHPDYNRHPELPKFIFDQCLSDIIWQLSYKNKYLEDKVISEYLIAGVIELIPEMDHFIKYKSMSYQNVIRYIHDYFDFAKCTDTINEQRYRKRLTTETQEFLKLLDIEKDLKNGVIRPEFDTDKFTNRYFAYYVDSLYKEKSHLFLPNEVSDLLVEDYDGNIKSIRDIFDNAATDYIMLNMLGSWCKPCLNEISNYKLSKAWDFSSLNNPVWLFFENEKSSAWREVVENNNLQKDDCYVAVSENTANMFSKYFGWYRKFPHAFIFHKTGKKVSVDAPKVTQVDSIVALLKAFEKGL